MKHFSAFFYSHLIEIDTIVAELDKLDLSEEQKIHLAGLIDSSLHHVILDTVLSQLSEQDKKIFIDCLQEENHDKIWKFLNQKIDNIEDKIKKAADELKVELHKDLKEVKST